MHIGFQENTKNLHTSTNLSTRKMLTNSHFALKPSQRTALTTFFQKLSKLAKRQEKSRPSNTHNTFSQKNAHWFPRKHQEFAHQYKFVNMKKC